MLAETTNLSGDARGYSCPLNEVAAVGARAAPATSSASVLFAQETQILNETPTE